MCSKCRCNVTFHERIFFEQKLVTNQLEMKALKNAVMSKKDAFEYKKTMIKNSRQMIQGFEKELYFIMETMAKFSLFLSQNGISQKIDIFEKHIRNILENEKRICQNVQSYDDKKCIRLENLLSWYQDIHEKVVKEYGATQLSVTDIHEIRQKLFAMPLTGSKIAEIFDIHVEVDKNDHAENITRCDKESILKQSASWYQTFKNRLFSFFG